MSTDDLTQTDSAVTTGHGAGSGEAPERIVASLGPAERVRLLSGRGFWKLESLREHGLEGIHVSDGPHGLRCQDTGGDHVGLSPAAPATCFPTAAALGSSWDETLVDEVGRAIGVEALALGVSVVLGPGLNIKRHPAGGRNFEYLSEDPLLSGRLAAAMVRGIQSRGVGACIKHFAVNNHESHRLVVDAVVDERTLRELYLAGFEIAVKESRPWTVMSSYNLLNGTYTSEHRELLTDILRDEWGFEGLVMSDWGAVSNRAAGIAAGLDLEMPGSRGACDPDVLAALDNGELDATAVDRCATRVVELLRRGQLDEPGGELPTGEHHQLARRAAAAGSVLLVNDGVLPLHSASRIAVVGEFAREPRCQGAGSSQVNPTRLDTALEAMRERLGPSARLEYARGYEARDGSTSPELLAEALGVARGADVVVLYTGLPAAWESEGFDRSTLDLPSGQVELIEALAATSTPLVVVLNNGGVVHMPWAQRVDAVLECWLGGQAGGSASVDVLFGDAEPGGRLAESIPVHVAQLPAHLNFPGRPRQVEYREGPFVGYRFHDTAGVPALFAFGSGLSYTSFEWQDAAIEGADSDFEVSVTVTNTGERRGSEVVQVYVRDPEFPGVRPDKELKGFAKVHLDPGESLRVTVELDRRSFATWDPATHQWRVRAGSREVIVGRSSVDAVQTFVVRVDSPAEEPEPGDPRAVDPEGSTAQEPGWDPAEHGWVADDEAFARLLGGPLPGPRPLRPFDRNSTLEDLEETRIGRMLSSLITREAVRRSSEEFPDPDEATLRMVRSAVREGPARALVLMSGGAIRFEHLDALLDAMNGNWNAAARRAFEQLRAIVGATD